MQTFSRFSIVSLHNKSNEPRLLSPESECWSSLTNCQTAQDQDLRKLGNLKKIPEMLGIDDKYQNSKKAAVKHFILKPVFNLECV